jgi:alpha/beta superfamily hydrolase
VAAQLYAARAEQHLKVPDALLLFGSAVERFRFREVQVPDHTLLVHGEVDEVVPLSEAMAFARAHELPMVVVPDASHFFHGKLIMLKNLLQQRLQAI